MTLAGRLRRAVFGAAVAIAATALFCVGSAVAEENAVLSFATPADQPIQVCLTYYPEFKELPQGPDAASMLTLISLVSQSSCEKPYAIDLKDKVVMIQDTGNCTLDQAIQAYKAVGAYALIIALHTNKIDEVSVQKTPSSATDMVVVLATNKTSEFLEKLLTPKEPLPVKLYTKFLEVDPGLAIIWGLAVFSVAIGSYWSGNIRHQVYLCEADRRRELAARRRRSSTGSVGRRPSLPHGMNVIEEHSSLDVSPVWVLGFVFMMASMLVILYLFIAYLVYFINGMFALSSAVATLGVLEPLAYKLPCGTARLPVNAVPCFHGSLEVRQALVLAVSAMVPAFWVYIRHHPLSWILQDLLGVCFSVYILRVLRLPNMKICTLLLSILFFYDIFFVFLTPLLIPTRASHNATASFVNATGKGDSIMVEVARGGGSKETIPMVMRVPRFGNRDLAPCLRSHSLLGFGDILVPVYGLGLLATFLALILMRMAQPALLYLVPFTVLPTLAIAWFRGELEDIWKGNLPREDTHSESDVSLSETTPGDTFKNIEPDPRKLVSQPVQPAFQPAGSYGFALAETPQQNLAAEKFL
ncbi:signal peptide peptidase-like 2B isoform X2 [Amblyomma americanum]